MYNTCKVKEEEKVKDKYVSLISSYHFSKSRLPFVPEGQEQSEQHSLQMVASSGTQNEKDILSDNSVTLGLEYDKCHDLKVSLRYVFVISSTTVFFNLCLFGECHITMMPTLHSEYQLSPHGQEKK